ncbi:Cna B-type domain-containing protein [Halolactibacillus halophilus]|nr:Cna B-type domain-containing protein [Halolactibacillus halophilus]
MWESDQSSDRPETITVEVYQNDKLYQTLIVDASNNWSYQINDVPQFDEAGIPYVYTIDEQPVEGYTTKIDGFNIINRKNESLSQGDTLPDTATQTFNLVLIGLVLIGMSAMIWIGLRFKKNKQ